MKPRRFEIVMNNDFEDIFGLMEGFLGTNLQPRALSNTSRCSIRQPKSDIYETENSVIAAFELPGVDKKDIELNITDDLMEVKVIKKQEKKAEDKEKGVYSYKACSRQFYKSVKLPTSVDSAKAKAEYRDGLLRIEIPKAKTVKKRLIRID